MMTGNRLAFLEMDIPISLSLLRPYINDLMPPIYNVLPHSPNFYILVVANIIVWSLHFVLRHRINQLMAEDKRLLTTHPNK